MATHYHYQLRFTISSSEDPDPDSNGVSIIGTPGYVKFGSSSGSGTSNITGILTGVYNSKNVKLENSLSNNTPTVNLHNIGNNLNVKNNEYTLLGSLDPSGSITYADIGQLQLSANFLDYSISPPSSNVIQYYYINSIPVPLGTYNTGQISYQFVNNPTFYGSNSYITFISVAGPDPIDPACFIEGIKLYTHVKNKDVYINIENLRSGDLVNTYLHGKKSIKFIGKGHMINNPSVWNRCVKKLPKSNNMIDDLLVTGAHSILVDTLSEKEEEGMVSIYGTADRKIDDKTLVLSWVSDKFEAVHDNKEYTYYHLVLEHDNDENKRYGIWANGVLTESQSEKHFLAKPYDLI